MNHRALIRIFKKNFGISEPHEIEALLAPLGKEFALSFWEVLSQIDTAFTDQDKVIEIRDRSLSISSKELLVLNDEISQVSKRQETILSRLKVMLNLLSNKSQAADTSQDLESIILAVQTLLESQIRHTESLKILFEEGRKLSSARDVFTLHHILQLTIQRLSPNPTQIWLELQEDLKILDPENLLPKSDPKAGNALKFVIDSTSNSKVLAQLIVSSQGSMGLFFQDQIRALVPNIATNIENIFLAREEKLKDHLANELKTARFVQQALVPNDQQSTGSFFEVHGYYESASECGGDWWSRIELPNGKLLVLVGDVTGHGTASAMITAVVKGYCDSLLTRQEISPAQLLQELNSVVFKMSTDSQRAMTMLAVLLDSSRSEITYANAGHPHPLVIGSAANTAVRYALGSGDVLGVTPQISVTDRKLSFSPGEKVIIFTDGLTESLNKSDECYGDRRLVRLLRGLNASASAESTNRAIIEDCKRFANGRPLNDDITSVVIRAI